MEFGAQLGLYGTNYWSNIRQKRSTKIDNKSKREIEKIEFFKSQFENRLNL